MIKSLNFDLNKLWVQFTQKCNKIKSASTFYFEQVHLSTELEFYEFWILLWIDLLQRELYTDFWLILSALYDAFHVSFDFIHSYFDLISLMFLNFELQFCSTLIWISLHWHQQNSHFSINAAYYLHWHADNLLHSFLWSCLFILNQIFDILMIFNETSRFCI